MWYSMWWLRQYLTVPNDVGSIGPRTRFLIVWATSYITTYGDTVRLTTTFTYTHRFSDMIFSTTTRFTWVTRVTLTYEILSEIHVRVFTEPKVSLTDAEPEFTQRGPSASLVSQHHENDIDQAPDSHRFFENSENLRDECQLARNEFPDIQSGTYHPFGSSMHRF